MRRNKLASKERYESLIRYLFSVSDRFCALERGEASVINDFLEHCPPISSRIVTEWPGTILGGDTSAKLYDFECSHENCSYVLGVTSEFDDWIMPFLEDIHFHKGDLLIFGSICHEKDYWFESKEIGEKYFRYISS